MRLARFLAQAGVASRRASEELIRSGKIMVNGRRCTEVATNVEPGEDKVTYKGRPLHVKKKVHLAFNKPVGYVCTAHDPFEPQTIYELLPKAERLFSVGRLDKGSEGLLIVTNDGDFANKLSHPSYEIPKKYRVNVKGKFTLRVIDDIIRDGITYDGVHYNVLDIKIKRRHEEWSQLIFTLNEGKNREIRNICKAIGLQVEMLKRIQIGKLKMADLPLGSWRELSEKELELLMTPPKI
jgi:23S rRNA pseudouridine2605 synthase